MIKETLHNFKQAIKYPRLAVYEAERPLRKLFSPAIKSFFELRYGTGLDVIEQDWDTLVILDACRYDSFKQCHDLKGSLQPAVSRGAHSWEFMQGNFVDRELHDTVYVTANPHTPKLSNDVFHYIDPLYDERWDEELETVLPENVVSASLNAYEAYPNKRHIIHFMQPHKPHLGPTAKKLRERINPRGWDKYHIYDNIDRQTEGMGLTTAIRKGIVSVSELRRAYNESLICVLNHVKELVEKLDGKTVITSDHGELLGERVPPLMSHRYLHPHDVYTKNLRIVPWNEMPWTNRRKIVSEEPVNHDKPDQETVNDRLQALGYAPS
jgi:hypothetical protein